MCRSDASGERFGAPRLIHMAWVSRVTQKCELEVAVIGRQRELGQEHPEPSPSGVPVPVADQAIAQGHRARRNRQPRSPADPSRGSGLRMVKGLWPYRSIRGRRPFGSRIALMKFSGTTSPALQVFPPMTRLRSTLALQRAVGGVEDAGRRSAGRDAVARSVVGPVAVTSGWKLLLFDGSPQIIQCRTPG